jgi:S1-C subfamily serine protease
MNSRHVTLIVCIALAGLLAAAPGSAESQQPLPTPRGQLGGPAPLQLTPGVPSTPIPTPTPMPTPTTPTATGIPPTSTPPQTPANPTTPSELLPATLTGEDAVAAVAPSVVTVIASRTRNAGPTPNAETIGTGSGFVLDEAGHIVTAAAIIDGAETWTIIAAGGDSQPAELIGSDPLTGVAVLRMAGSRLVAARLGAPSALRPGQPVLALGTAYGTFPNTVTSGVISAIDRRLPERFPATNLIQHSAPTFDGGSGGPLVTLTGEVVGINVLSLASGDSRDASPNVSFAVPVDTVERIAKELIADGRIRYPYLGAAVDEPPAGLTSSPASSGTAGALITSVAGDGPAAQAGIVTGDRILQIDQESVGAASSFSQMLFAYHPGDTIHLTVRRGDADQTIDVVLGERPATGASPSTPAQGG